MTAHVTAHVPAHGSSFPTSSQTRVVNFFLMTAILTGVTQTFRTVLRCTSLANEEVEWFLTYLGAVCISSVKKGLCHSYSLYCSSGLGFLWCFVSCGFIYIFLDLISCLMSSWQKLFPLLQALCSGDCFFCWIPLCFSGMCRFSGLLLAAGELCSESSPSRLPWPAFLSFRSCVKISDPS